MSAPIYVGLTFGNTARLRRLAPATMPELQATARRAYGIGELLEAGPIFLTTFARGKHYELSSSYDLEAAIEVASGWLEVHIFTDEATYRSALAGHRISDANYMIQP
eukprot:TRINITY_DN16853_c0_g1_i1.p2 TRINITY_DN16853_c0_g1~~TRINITY_DN16853_c0_g1_i1.p2  ORF type:complete len:107 (+),score=18.23 TRINITY_DN16853_c0_g1_i1:153-473(+)